ncbi:enoyl-CoA hydratase-related protein [Sagittula sp. S175]|uniref:enoyl-CoA hydratase-related protein n=1 Tax=Sagittula sp. S175 TaxID=3415129 RepID=UPI003C7B0DBB
MAEGIHYSVREGVALLSVDHPPVNALSHPVRAGIEAALDRAEDDPTVDAVVVMGTGSTFPAGADLTEYESGLKAPFLRDICARVEACAKPVIAALHGTVYGGGLELALAAHYRIALQGTRASLPEVRMGLTPSAGATQRLPRLVGTPLALELMLTGGTLPLDRGPGLSLIDETCVGNLRDQALAYARRLLEAGQGPRPTSERRDGFADYATHTQAIATRRGALTDGADSAMAQVLHLVEAAALLPFETGIAMEQDAFETCLASDAAKALRHAFTAERLARRFALPKGTVLPEINRIAVLGPGPLAMQITVSALNAGIGVNWGAREPEKLREGVEQLREVFAAGVKGGGLSPEQSQARLQLLHWGESAEMIGGADMVLHAARGQGDVPAPRGTIRAVAMSARVDELGLRFAPPVFSTRLVEVVQGADGTAEQLAYGLALAERMHKVPVHVMSSGTSIAGRLAAALHRAADALLDLGADPYAVDAAVEDWGWPRPPFRTRDMMGLEDLSSAHRAEGAENWSSVLVDVDRRGWVSGKGFYDWTDDGPERSDAVKRLLNGQRAARPLEQMDMVMLLVGAMANEGARMLSEGMAQKASDIDAVAILAQDFPRAKGGPMMAVGQWGMLKVMKKLERLDHADTDFWMPQASWAEHVKYGRTFLSR